MHGYGVIWVLVFGLSSVPQIHLPNRGASSPVTVTWKDTPLAQALQDLTKQTGIEFDLDSRLKGTVTLTLKDAPPFQAVHELCRAHGNARLLFSTFSPRIRIEPGTPSRAPTHNQGSFHSLLAAVLVTRSHAFDGKKASRTTITIWNAWTESPAAIAEEIEISEALDDTGKDLRIPGDPSAKFRRLLGKRLVADVATIRLEAPAGAATKIRSLKGTRKVIFIGETRDLKIEGFDAGPAASKGGEFSIQNYARKKTGISAIFEGPRSARSEFSFADHFPGLAFVDSEGRVYPVRVATAAEGPERSRFEGLCQDVPEKARIVACTALYVVQWKDDTIPFEFSNVELP